MPRGKKKQPSKAKPATKKSAQPAPVVAVHPVVEPTATKAPVPVDLHESDFISPQVANIHKNPHRMVSASSANSVTTQLFNSFRHYLEHAHANMHNYEKDQNLPIKQRYTELTSFMQEHVHDFNKVMRQYMLTKYKEQSKSVQDLFQGMRASENAFEAELSKSMVQSGKRIDEHARNHYTLAKQGKTTATTTTSTTKK